MAIFTIKGPFEITYEKRPGGRVLVFDDFWNEDSPAAALADECGCYVFAVRAGKGITPIYVGKAARTFQQETFNSTNKHKYHSGFSEYARGTPVMFFVVHPEQRGRKNEKEIEEIEDFLIQNGVARNPEMQNVRGAQQPAWGIYGVIRGGKGKSSHAQGVFRRIFDI